MTRFVTKNDAAANKLIRHDPQMQRQIFGAEDVVPFWVADVEFPVAEPNAAELKRLAERGVFAYEFHASGVFDAISQWYRRRHGLQLNTDNFVQFPGVLTGVALLVREPSDVGDGVVIQSPAFHQFSKIITTADREVVKSPLRIVDGRYEMNFSDLQAKCALEHVKAMILCNPHNPVGRVWQRHELRSLLEIAEKHNVTIISDEINADIVLSGHTFNTLMSLDNGQHAALIGLPSKTFGMQSISNGYVYTSNEAILAAMKHVADSMYLGHGNAFTTFATIAAYKHGDAWLDEFLKHIESNAAWIEAFLADNLPSIKSYPLEGNYQIWLDYRSTGLTPETLREKLAEAKLGMTPGAWFEPEPALFARMNIASPRSEIVGAFSRLKSAL